MFRLTSRRIKTALTGLTGLLFSLSLEVSVHGAGIEEPLKPALELHEAGKVKEAIALYDKFIKANPKNAEGYFNRGNAYYDLGQNDLAVRDYSEVIKLNPKDSEAYYNRGNAYRHLKKDAL